jgi:hypothetical protein
LVAATPTSPRGESDAPVAFASRTFGFVVGEVGDAAALLPNPRMGSTRLRRVVFGVAPKTLLDRLLARPAIRWDDEKFGRDIPRNAPIFQLQNSGLAQSGAPLVALRARITEMR